MKINTKTDEELVSLYKTEPQNKWIEALFDRHIRFVFAVCMKYLKDEEQAKDISMQVFEKAIQDLPRFEIQNFKSWIYTVTRNACMMHFRSLKTRKNVIVNDEKLSTGFMESSLILHPDNDDDLNGELKYQQLEEAMLNLENEQKKCIELFYLKDKSYKEVVEITGFSLNQVKSYIQNGKRNLKNQLVKLGNFEFLLLILLIAG